MHNMKVNINGVGICYTDTGYVSGIPVIFIHGFPFDKTMWTPQLKSIPAKYRAIAYDIRGHGQSDFGDGQYLIEFFVDDLNSLMDYLKISKAVLIGLSMGGYIVLRTVERNPDRVLAIVLCNTKSDADTNEIKIRRARQIKIINTSGIHRFTDDFLKAVFSEKTFLKSPDTIDMIRKIILKTSPPALISTLIALAARTSTTDALNQIKIPTLILTGENDTLTTPMDAIKMQQLIPDSEMYIIPDAAHLSNLENTTLFNKYLFSFLDKLNKED